MLRIAAFITCFGLFLSILISCVESSEVKLISPTGAAVRSIIPGWGQFYTNDKLMGSAIFLTVGILVGGGVEADAIYRDFYNNKYTPAILSDSSEADSYFDKSNQYYKLSRFLLYTAAGIWAYSILDAYVDAHIYNARQQLRMLDVDDARLQQLKLTSASMGAGSDYPLSLRASVVFALSEAKAHDEQCSMFQFNIQHSGCLASSRIRGD